MTGIKFADWLPALLERWDGILEMAYLLHLNQILRLNICGKMEQLSLNYLRLFWFVKFMHGIV